MLGWEFPPYFAGGVGVVCYSLTKALAQRGENITYFMPSGPKNSSSAHVQLLIANNLVPGTVNVNAVDSTLQPYTSVEEYTQHYQSFLEHQDGGAGKLYGQDLLSEVERFAKKLILLISQMDLDFDVIHAHDWTTFPAALALKKLTGKPMIAHVHITEFDKTGGDHADPRVYEIEKAGMDGADRVIAVSNLVKNRCVYQYHTDPAKICIIYNAVTEHATPNLPQRYNIKKNDHIVLFLGRITLQKGPDYFVEAARKVLDINPNVKFIMAGTGDMLPRMIERAADLGIGHRMIFPGFVSQEEGAELYKMADVFVMPSVSEPFGIVPLEAMSHGTPVIISRQSGVSEVLAHALKVDFWDVEDTASKIVAALSYKSMHEELQLQGTTEVARFNWDSVAKQVQGIYQELRGG